MELTGVKISLRRKGARTAGALHSTGGGQGVSASMAGEISTLTQRLEGLRSLLIPVASDGAELDYSQASLAVRLKSRLDLYSEGNLSALGATTDGGTGGTGGGGGGGSLFGLMRDWPATDPGKSTEDALGANLGWELRQGLADVRAQLDTHVADSVRHITGSERTRWNKAATDLSAIMGSDGDNVLNKWEEIVAFLATYTEADTLANLLSNKADKSQLSGYVTLDTEQEITGQKIFGTHMLIDCPWDTHDRYLFFREGGTSTYGGYVKYCGDDSLRIGTRNGDETVDVDAISIKRGSTRVWLKGNVEIAGYTTVGNGLSVTGTVTADTIKRRGGTSLQLLTADGGIRTLHTLGAVGNLGWSGTSGQVVSVNTLAHWDGRFMGTQSNLLYCAKGAFGDIVTRNTADFVLKSGDALSGLLTLNAGALIPAGQSLTIGGCEITWDAAQGALRFSTSAYSEGEMAGKGATSDSDSSSGGTTGGGSYDRLDSWNDYDAGAGAVLSATLGYGLLTDINALRTDVTALKGAGFLTEHQDISHLLKIDGSNGTVAGVQALIGKLPVWGGAPTDTALFIAQSTSYPSQWGLRTTSSLWNWLKPKTDAVYQPKGDYQTPNGYVASLYSANALPLKAHSLQYYSGQPTKDLCFEGSSTDLSLWSYPGPGITSVGENSVNIQSLRMWFGSMWLNEIFCSPNANGLWYRHAVNNSTATHEWERILTDANFHTVTGKDYVRIIGDKMTGRLTAPSIGINGAGSTAYLHAGNNHDVVVNVSGKNLLVVDGSIDTVMCGNSVNGTVSLGTSSIRWKNVYATTINVSSAELVSKLNADMVDGHHEGDFLINQGGNYKGLLYDIPCKSFYSGCDIEDAPGAGWVSGIVLGANFNSDHYQAHLVHHNNYDRWYSTSRHKDGKMTTWNEFAFVTSNVASATKLQTARSIWGQGFNGTADVKGNLYLSDYCYIGTDSVGTGLRVNRHESKVWKRCLLEMDGDGNMILNNQLTVNGAATLKSAVTVNGQLTATGNAIVRGTLDVNGILTATNKVRLYDELFFEPAGNAGPYLSPAGGKLSIAFHDNYTWVKTPIVLDKDGLLTLDGQLKIGGITMSYDASQGALRIEGNAYATGNMSALGLASDAALLPEGMLTETFIGRLDGGGETDEPVGGVIDFNDLSSLEAYSGINANGEEDVLFNLGYLGINRGVVREIDGKSYADYGKIALAVMPLMVEKVSNVDTRLSELSNRVAALERK